MDPTDLDAWVDAARGGDGSAFGLIWTALAGQVVGYFRAHGCRDAEDLTSETFLAAFSRIDTFEGGGSAFRSWLFTIAHHKRVDDVRRHLRRPDPVPYEAELDSRMTRSGVGADWEGGGIDPLALIADLPPDQGEVLTLRFVADLSLEETAQALDRSVGAVKSLQHRALESVRHQLDRSQRAKPESPGSTHPFGRPSVPAVSPRPGPTIAEM